MCQTLFYLKKIRSQSHKPRSQGLDIPTPDRGYFNQLPPTFLQTDQDVGWSSGVQSCFGLYESMRWELKGGFVLPLHSSPDGRNIFLRKIRLDVHTALLAPSAVTWERRRHSRAIVSLRRNMICGLNWKFDRLRLSWNHMTSQWLVQLHKETAMLVSFIQKLRNWGFHQLFGSRFKH